LPAEAAGRGGVARSRAGRGAQRADRRAPSRRL